MLCGILKAYNCSPPTPCSSALESHRKQYLRNTLLAPAPSVHFQRSVHTQSIHKGKSEDGESQRIREQTQYIVHWCIKVTGAPRQ